MGCVSVSSGGIFLPSFIRRSNSSGVLVSKVIGWLVAGCLKEIDFA